MEYIVWIVFFIIPELCTVVSTKGIHAESVDLYVKLKMIENKGAIYRRRVDVNATQHK